MRDGLLIAWLARALDGCCGAERAYVEFYGEVTPHLHVYLTARYPGVPSEYWRANLGKWPDAPMGGAEEIAALGSRLRAHVSQQIEAGSAR